MASQTKTRRSQPRWLVLFHQVPPKPDYLRVRVGRQLRGLGAIGIKNSVYVLPNRPGPREGLGRVAREIRQRGGEAVVCEARFVEGLADQTVEGLFREARDRDYAAVAEDARALAAAIPGRGTIAEAQRRGFGRRLERLERRCQAIADLDLFGSGGRDAAIAVLSLVADRLQGIEEPSKPGAPIRPVPGTIWVTRTGVMVDRIASAWLIRRFIDRAARFKFVGGRGYRPSRGEIRFDMAGAEFTHEGERCTFEVLLERFDFRSAALEAIAEIVHDLDLEDGRYGRPEASGVRRMIVGIALATPEDGARLERGATVFDGLYASFGKKSH